jgi:aryl-alcohol dehydrogenase-like predicted oxidoreductase
MIRRDLGKTGLKTSVIGFGGFHLVETARSDAERLLNRYLDEGGNYIETARGYGNGISERKIGDAVSHRRNEYILATKSERSKKEEILDSLDQSLAALKTDHVDILFMHGVQTIEKADAVLGPGGAMEGALKAQKDGKVR